MKHTTEVESKGIVLVHERDRKGSQNTTQAVEVYFNFVGKYVPPHFGEVALIAEAQEELRKKEERKDRLRRNKHKTDSD